MAEESDACRYPAGDLLPKVIEALELPTSSLITLPKPFGVNPSPRAGEPLFVERGRVEYGYTSGVQGADWFWDERSFGYWAGHSSLTLRIKNLFRDDMPIWSHERQWSYGESVLGCQPYTGMVWKFRLRVERQRLEECRMSGRFMPVTDRYRHDSLPLRYHSRWQGDLRRFSGSETISDSEKKEVVWSATIQGGLIIPIS